MEQEASKVRRNFGEFIRENHEIIMGCGYIIVVMTEITTFIVGVRVNDKSAILAGLICIPIYTLVAIGWFLISKIGKRQRQSERENIEKLLETQESLEELIRCLNQKVEEYEQCETIIQ